MGGGQQQAPEQSIDREQLMKILQMLGINPQQMQQQQQGGNEQAKKQMLKQMMAQKQQRRR